MGFGNMGGRMGGGKFILLYIIMTIFLESLSTLESDIKTLWFQEWTTLAE